MRMKKALKFAALFLAVLTVLCGCTVTKTKESSLTFNVNTGDRIKVTLNRIDGYKMDSKTPFTVSKDDKDIITGSFLTKDGYDQYYELIKGGDSDAEVIKESTKDGNSYIMYKVTSNGKTEYDFIVMITNSSTGVLMGSLESEEDAAACFEALKFELIK
ncbi:MAG: hypothetical protein HDT13_12145 [Butyrivibrio sp.]|nr:hypothetical protein [Butyrivibrio sp.]